MGDFDKYSLDEIKEIVNADDPAAMREQVEGWKAMKTFFDEQLRRFDERVGPLQTTWSGPAADVFFGEVAGVRQTLKDAVDKAQGNAEGWTAIAARTETAQGKVAEIYSRYQTAMNKANTDYEKAKQEDKDNFNWGWGGLSDIWDDPDAPKQDEVRAPFDREARSEMDSATTVAQDQYIQKIFYPPTFEPFNDVGEVKDPGEWPEYTNTENNEIGGSRKRIGGPDDTLSPPPSTPPPTPPSPPPTTPPPNPSLPDPPPFTPPPNDPELEFPPVPPTPPPPFTPPVPPTPPPPFTPPPNTPPPYVPPPPYTPKPPPTGGKPPVLPKPPPTGKPPVPPKPPVTGRPPVVPKPPGGPKPPVTGKPPVGPRPPLTGKPPVAPKPPGTFKPGGPPGTGPVKPPVSKTTQLGKVSNPVIGQRSTGTQPPSGTRNPAMPRETPGSRGVIGQRGAQSAPPPARGAGQPGVRAAAPKPVKVPENGVIRGARGGQNSAAPPRQGQRTREEEEDELYSDAPLDDDLFRVDGGVPGVFTSKLPYEGGHESGPALSGRDDRN